MAKRILRFNTIKDYIKEEKGMRSNDLAVKALTKRFNSLLRSVIDKATEIATGKKRKTISKKDMATALEQTVGKQHLLWQELLGEILLQAPTDLGKISKGINKHINKPKKSSKK